jgi:hypothetical protein
MYSSEKGAKTLKINGLAPFFLPVKNMKIGGFVQTLNK